MGKLKLNNEAIIEAYNNSESMNSIAKRFNTYPTTIKRILERNKVELRHDTIKTGSLIVKDGEKLIEWAKAQGRLVTKAELAKVLGKTRLSHSYFIKYPELGQYVTMREQNELNDYTEKLHKWLQENNIQYKPNDRKTLGVMISALLLGSYANMAIQIDIKPKCVSKKRYKEIMLQKLRKANEAKVIILFLKEEHFKDLDCIKGLLDSLKYSEER